MSDLSEFMLRQHHLLDHFITNDDIKVVLDFLKGI